MAVTIGIAGLFLGFAALISLLAPVQSLSLPARRAARLSPVEALGAQ